VATALEQAVALNIAEAPPASAGRPEGKFLLVHFREVFEGAPEAVRVR
jgi:hypothetical protein